MQIETISTFDAITNPGGMVAITTLVQPAPQLATPSGLYTTARDGVITFGGGGGLTANGLVFSPFGVGTAGFTFDMYIFGWRDSLGAQGTINSQKTWRPDLLARWTCTLASPTTFATAPAGGDIASLSSSPIYYCDTLALVFGNANVSVETISPTGGFIASGRLDGIGYRLIEVRFATGSTGTSATSANAQYSTV